MAEPNRYQKAARKAMDQEQGGVDAALEKKTQPRPPRQGVGDLMGATSKLVQRRMGEMFGADAADRVGKPDSIGKNLGFGKGTNQDAFFVRQDSGRNPIRLPRSVYQGPVLPPELTAVDRVLEAGFVRRPGESRFRNPVVTELGALPAPGTENPRAEWLGPRASTGSDAGDTEAYLAEKALDQRLGAAYAWEGESLPEDISERDRLLEKFPLPSYEKAKRMRAGIDEILAELVANKSAEKRAAHTDFLKKKYGDVIGGALNVAGRMGGVVGGVRLSDEEEEELFQEAGREYLRRTEEARAAMEDTPAG